MTDFYAYFALTGIVSTTVGATSEQDALDRDLDPLELVRDLHEGTRPIAIELVEGRLVNLLPSWQAEEYAGYLPPGQATGAPPAAAPARRRASRGIQRL
ncbi:MAG: hypothetical protein ACO3KD_02575, partial [Gaiellales bacterium]